LDWPNHTHTRRVISILKASDIFRKRVPLQHKSGARIPSAFANFEGVQLKFPSSSPFAAKFIVGSMHESNVDLMTRFILITCLWTVAAGIASSQTLKVVPGRVLVDETAVIRAEGLAPNEHVSIRAELVDGANQPWSSEAEFLADPGGAVDTSKQAPVKGSYSGVSAMGLVWSMKPKAKHVPSYDPPRDLGAQVIEFQLFRSGKQVAIAQLEQLSIADGVRRITIDGQLHGVLLLPNSTGPHPGVLVVGGSEGGMPLRKAAWLASRGYAALALAYFRYDDLPPLLEAIPLEYFSSGLAWMVQRPEISGDRVAVVGTSRSGELALQLGSMFPEIKAVVAYVPANVRYAACCGDTRVPYAWTWQGQPLSFGNRRALREPGASVLNGVIAVERAHGPILLIAGDDDGVWDSSGMTDAVVSRLKQAHFSFSYERLRYAHAGHRAGRPEIVPTQHGGVRNPTSQREENLGGNAQGDAESSLDAIPKVLEFLRQSLGEPQSNARFRWSREGLTTHMEQTKNDAIVVSSFLRTPGCADAPCNDVPSASVQALSLIRSNLSECKQ